MAVRSGAGTGVVASLVIFVILTIALLIFTIIFYVGKTEALESAAAARADLDRFVREQERNDERVRALVQEAGTRSVTGHLTHRYDELARWVSGTTPKSLTELKTEMEGLGVSPTGSVRGTLEDQTRRIRNLTSELDAARQTLANRDEAMQAQGREMQAMRAEHAQALAAVSESPRRFERANEEYRQDLRRSIETINRAKDDLRAEYDGRIADLESEIDERGRELVRLRSRIEEFERIMNESRMRASSPELLVDARVLDVDPANEQIFLDRGRQDRIVLGMGFEIYENAAAIRPDPRTQLLPRGKATVQVVQVGDRSSTAKIVRAVPGRPIGRGDVLANAVYDPNRTFKFLVHGRFDVDGDGIATEAEAEYLRSLVIGWGGQVVYGEELPGDLDFLVLGEEPPMPAPLPGNPTPGQIEEWSRQRLANLQYNELFGQARQAQIPVLNANRFFILTGLGANR